MEEYRTFPLLLEGFEARGCQQKGAPRALAGLPRDLQASIRALPMPFADCHIHVRLSEDSGLRPTLWRPSLRTACSDHSSARLTIDAQFAAARHSPCFDAPPSASTPVSEVVAQALMYASEG